MSNTIQIKRSSTPSAVPTAGQLQQGELAVNLADKKLYTKDQTNAVVLLNPESPPFSINGLTTTAPATNDFLPFSDTSDSNTNKKATVQSIVDLASSTTSVLAATAGASVGAVGTYALLRFSSRTAADEGNTYAGSILRYASANGTIGSAPSGTWRLMGNTSSGSDAGSTSVFLRIS